MLNFGNHVVFEPENIDVEWARLMRTSPPALELESVQVKQEMKVESVDDSTEVAKASPTFDLDF